MNQERTGSGPAGPCGGRSLVVWRSGATRSRRSAFFFHRDPKMPAKYPLQPRTGPKKEKEKELAVLVMTQVSPGQAYEFWPGRRRSWPPGWPQDYRVAKEDKQKVMVIPQAKVNKFKVQQPEVEGHAAGGPRQEARGRLTSSTCSSRR